METLRLSYTADRRPPYAPNMQSQQGVHQQGDQELDPSPHPSPSHVSPPVMPPYDRDPTFGGEADTGGEGVRVSVDEAPSVDFDVAGIGSISTPMSRVKSVRPTAKMARRGVRIGRTTTMSTHGDTVAPSSPIVARHRHPSQHIRSPFIDMEVRRRKKKLIAAYKKFLSDLSQR
ncbi:hypothetical protein PTKIN_Ptkin01aG0304000 [Pterospermum kingtungense]